MNQSDLKENTCRLSQERKKACGQILISTITSCSYKKNLPNLRWQISRAIIATNS